MRQGKKISHILRSLLTEAEADLYGRVDRPHRTVVEVAHLFFQPLFVDGSDLLEEYNAVLGQSCRHSGKVYMGRELCLSEL